jgi:hypothetical protein
VAGVLYLSCRHRERLHSQVRICLLNVKRAKRQLVLVTYRLEKCLEPAEEFSRVPGDDERRKCTRVL